MKLIDRIRSSIISKDVFYSFEYFPPSSSSGLYDLQAKIDRMADMQPVFVDITASNGNHEDTLGLCKDVLRFCGVDVVMNVTCVGMTRHRLIALLDEAKKSGIQNILAVHGDVGSGYVCGPDELRRSVEIVRIAREVYGDYFTVAVAGYPERCDDYKLHIEILKEKFDAGADFCVTEMFFDTSIYKTFVEDCRAAGIPKSFPAIPGIFPIHSYKLFEDLKHSLRISVPSDIEEEILRLRNDDKALKAYGVELAGKMCIDLLNSGVAQGLHFYTFNLEHPVRRVLEDTLKVAPNNKLPWRPSADPKRLDEDVRPIFWANRPKSYLNRTDSWQEFPSGRWGDGSGPSFSAFNVAQQFPKEGFLERNEVRRKAWGEAPHTEEEIFEVFAGFIEGRVPFLPWCEERLHVETNLIEKKLISINRAGLLTINSQPKANAVPSNDPRLGWGPPHGYVYQKAYIEFFISPEKLRELMDLCNAPEAKSLVYHAVDHRGNTYSNSPSSKPNAVTWGAFPGREIIQPTIVDPASFLAWKEEAFHLWQSFASVYDQGSPSYDLLYDMHDRYFLVNIVDNDFINGDIFRIFDALLSRSNKSQA
mmetsp:Transcript_17675/g.28606  ORF Transcript_17675/g.28606 Transcript_17675/m.28606 type:complete len:590 (-) Transcript_17675:223-1992(-)|eukprot:CAMPEP_0203760134 /NCGR_PEP_ID=MMETSP0098-20131031/13501_1 /ASSEMBLY_ACC=CAM_ASM_000208 /TAXON_ID=96639 /ORGANISM=" , Strain NY0313808BC1" /LENGTH=589 /DNA_ID=CAMNT_0050653591 /DNA_START=754 /DNA_END=2523 /DNA_ORIENTATION=+